MCYKKQLKIASFYYHTGLTHVFHIIVDWFMYIYHMLHQIESILQKIPWLLKNPHHLEIMPWFGTQCPKTTNYTNDQIQTQSATY